MLSPEFIFTLTSQFALSGWLILISSWRWNFLKKLSYIAAIPLLLALVYTIVAALTFGRSEGNFKNLAGVIRLFSDPWVITAGWIHYLCFDLFIGIWQFNDAKKNHLRFWLMLPVWALTFLFGPAGLIAYFLLRWIITRKIFLIED